MSNVVRKVGAGSTTPADRIEWLKSNLHNAPRHRWERVADLIVRFERGDEIEYRDLNYALETADIAEKRMDSQLFK